MNSKWSRCVEKGKLKKGPWTFEEDIRLLRYIRVHGDGRWTTLAKAAGLQRCGKSCRLRWVNYLRPGIKRGNITPEEERLIIDLHARWGNRWSLIAERIPGRTDNEIKNYWRSHLKKKLQKLAQTADQTSAISQVQPKQVESLDVFACKEIKPPSSSYEDNYSHGAVKLETPMHIEGIDLQVQCCTQSSFLDSNQEETSIENGMAMAMVRADADELPPMLYSFPSGIPIESDATAIFEDSYCASELYGEYGCESEEVADIMLWNMCPIPNMELDTPFLSATHPLGHVNGQMPFSSLNVI